MPSVGFIATARTRFSPRCCSTSAMTSIASRPSFAGAVNVQRVVDRGQVSGLELDVDDRPDDLDDAADLLFGCGCGCHKLERLCA